MDVILLVSFYRYYLGLKLHFRHNGARKKSFLSSCYIGNEKVSLLEVDQKFPFGGINVYRISYLDSILCYSKVFRLHAKLHDAAGAVRSHNGKGRNWLRYYYWRRFNFSLDCPCDCAIMLSLRENLRTLLFHFCRLLKQYDFDCTRCRAN